MEIQQSRAFIDALLQGPAAAGGDSLAALRARALERAHALPVPTPRDEAWRFTDLAPLYRLAFRAPAAAGLPGADALAAHRVPEAGARLVFVDGRFAPSLSSPVAAGGLRVQPLAAARDLVDAHAGRLAAFEDDPFVAVNTARLDDGAVIHVARDHAADAPVHCLFVSTQADVVQHPRLLVVAESGSALTLLEDYVALHAGACCINAVTEVDVGAGASVRHVKLQRDSKAAFHIATTAARVARDGHYANQSVAFGARISRNNVNVVQAGTGTVFELEGLALIDGRQLADTHTFADHALAHGRSRQVHKCIAGGGAHAVFNGRILVRTGAQQTDSTQESRNLLLSDKAHVDTKPQLEIYADDVKCAHGATVGQLEAEEVFYLVSRGLSEATARDLLTFGFAADIVNRIPIASVVRDLGATILQRTGIQERA